MHTTPTIFPAGYGISPSATGAVAPLARCSVPWVQFFALWVALALLLILMPQRAAAQSALDGFQPAANAAVRTVAVQADGKVLVGGDFTTLAGQTRNRIARLNADGSLDPTFDPDANDLVYSLAVQADGKVLVGGAFTTLGGQVRNRIARLNADGTLDTGFDPGADSSVHSLAVQADGKVLLGGEFNTVGGQAHFYIARLNADGTLDAGFDAEAGDIVFSLAVQADGKILLGGEFGSVNGQTRNYLARLNADGTLDTGFNLGANYIPYSLVVQPDGKVLVGGGFTTLGGQPRNRIARLNADGTLDTAFNPNTNNYVYSMALQPDGKVLVGGSFTTVGGLARNRIARLNANGTVDAGFNPGAGNSVLSLAVQADGKVLVGGSFATLGGQTRNRIARLHVDGSLDANFSPNPNGGVISLAMQPDGKVLVGGAFTTVGGQTRNHIARLNADGSLDMSFDPNANNEVLCIALQSDGKVLLGGDFDKLGATQVMRNRVARLNADGTLDMSFNPDANGRVSSLAVQPDGKVLIGGYFTTLGESPQARNLIARLNADGSLDAAFNPDANDDVYSLALQSDGKVLVGGYFTSVGGQPRNHIARLNADGSLDTAFNPDANSGVSSLAVQPDGKVLVGGDFTTMGGQPRNRIARLNSDGSLDVAFNPNANNVVYSLVVQPDGKVLVGGAFTKLGAIQEKRIGIARLHADGTLDTSFDPTADTAFDPTSDAGVVSLAVQPDGKVLVGGDFSNMGGQPVDGIARLSVPEAALQSLQATTAGDGLRWWRSGSGPEVSQVRFAMSAVEDASESGWTDLGTAARIVDGWSLDSLNLPRGTPIWVRALGVASGGYVNGSSSLVRSVRQLFLLGAPGAPTGLAATAGNGAVTLSWTAPASDGGSPITGYTVSSAPAGSCTTTGALTCTVTGLTNGVAHTFTVTATNAGGTSTASASASATPQAAAPGVPTGLTAVAGHNAVALSWAAPVSTGGSAITGYTVTGAPAGSCTTTGAPTCTVTGLTNGVAHTFTVTATNAAGTSSPSAPALASPQVWSQPGVLLPGGGSADVQVGAPPSCTVSGAQFGTTVPPGAPAGASFPLGIFSFTAAGAGCSNATLSVRIDYPAGTLSGLQPHKHGPATAGAAATWFPHGAVSGNSVTYAVTDNGVGDNNPLLAAIDDPFAPILLAAGPGSPTAIPTLGEWALVMMSLFAAAVGMGSLRRRGIV